MTVPRLISILSGLLVFAAFAAGPQGVPPARADSADSRVARSHAEKEALLYLNVIDGLVSQRRYGAALAFLDNFAAASEPLSPRYWLLRGHAALGLGRQADAAAAYAKLDGSPLAAQGRDGLGRIAAAAKDWRQAEARFREAVSGEPSNADFLNNLAFAELHLGENADSASHLRQAHELAPGSDLIRNNLIIALTLSSDAGGADRLLDEIGDSARRQQLRAIIKSVIESNNHFKDGSS